MSPTTLMLTSFGSRRPSFSTRKYRSNVEISSSKSCHPAMSHGCPAAAIRHEQLDYGHGVSHRRRRHTLDP
eukprot:1090706-Amorphochlora_amoeboformis.AAC.1